MLLGDSIDQCIEKEGTRRKIDNRCADGAYRTDVPAWKTGRDRGPDVGALPNNRAGGGIERINIIRSGHDDDHRSVRAALDVERLSVNVPHDRAIKVQVSRELGRVLRCECGIDIQAVPRWIVIFLRDVNLRARTRHDTTQAENKNRENENVPPHTPPKEFFPHSFYNSTPVFCQGFTEVSNLEESKGVVGFAQRLPGFSPHRISILAFKKIASVL